MVPECGRRELLVHSGLIILLGYRVEENSLAQALPLGLAQLPDAGHGFGVVDLGLRA